jgi:hypothetical protein
MSAYVSNNPHIFCYYEITYLLNNPQIVVCKF